MKIRVGFVSNSSSSSFVILANDDIPTVFALARRMIALRDWGKSDKKDTSWVNKMEQKGLDPDTPLAFSTCNYDTYILPLEVDGKKVFAVSTCNNHPWYDNLDMADSRETLKLLGMEDYEDMAFDLPKKGSFRWLGTDIVGREPGGWDWECPTKGHYRLTQQTSDGVVICVDCGKKAVNRKKK